jgi:hypothetical protein
MVRRPVAQHATRAGPIRERVEPFQAIDIDLSLLWSYTALPRSLAEARAHYAIEGY